MSDTASQQYIKNILLKRSLAAGIVALIGPTIAGIFFSIQYIFINILFYKKFIGFEKILSAAMIFSYGPLRLDSATFAFFTSMTIFVACYKIPSIPLRTVFIGSLFMLVIAALNAELKAMTFLIGFFVPVITSAVVSWAITKSLHSPESTQ